MSPSTSPGRSTPTTARLRPATTFSATWPDRMIHTPVLLGAFPPNSSWPARSSIGCSESANAATSPAASGATAPRPTQRATQAASRIGASPVTYGGGDPGPIVAALAQVPELLQVAVPFIGAALGPSGIDWRSKEIVIVRTSALAGGHYCVAAHTVVALDAGLDRRRDRAAWRTADRAGVHPPRASSPCCGGSTRSGP